MSCFVGRDVTNPKKRLALPLESTVTVVQRSTQIWLGPKDSVEDSADASAQASALAAATAQAIGRPRQSAVERRQHPNALFNDQESFLDASLLVKQSHMLALNGALLMESEESPITLVPYKSMTTDAFLLKKNKPRGKQVAVASGDELVEEARATTIYVACSKIKKRLRRLRNLVHENVARFLFAAVAISEERGGQIQAETAKRRNSSSFHIVLANYERGTLEDALRSMRFPLPDSIKYSLCCDLIEGLQYIHRKHGPHGKISPRTCYVTEGWRLVVYLGGFESVAIRVETSQPHLYEAYEALATQLFSAPDDIEKFPHNYKTVPGDVYSTALVVNMVLNDGVRPFSDLDNVSGLISRLARDQHSILRPALPPNAPISIRKLIQSAWSFDPQMRPTTTDMLVIFQTQLSLKLTPSSSTASYSQPNLSNATLNLHLVTSFSRVCTRYLAALESAQQSTIAVNLGDAVAKRLAESDRAIHAQRLEHNKIVAELERQIAEARSRKVIEDGMGAAYGGAAGNSNSKQLLHQHVREVLMARLGMVPPPLAESIVSTAAKLSQMQTTAAVTMELDTIFRPTIFPNATVLVVSVAGFNRYVSQAQQAGKPAMLMDLLHAYYRAVDDAAESTNREHGCNAGGAGVFVVDRLADACVLVSGALERDARSAGWAVDVGVRLVEWATKWDAGKVVGKSNSPSGGASGGAEPTNNGRLLLRIGVHTGPLFGSLVGKVPKLLVLGETLNAATMIETMCGVQEMRISATTHMQVVSAGQGDQFVFEAKEEADLRTRGKLGVYKVLVDRY